MKAADPNCGDASFSVGLRCKSTPSLCTRFPEAVLRFCAQSCGLCPTGLGPVIVVKPGDPPAQDGDGGGIFAQFMSADGKKEGREIALNARRRFNQFDPVVTVLPRSSMFLALWTTTTAVGKVVESVERSGFQSRTIRAQNPDTTGIVIQGLAYDGSTLCTFNTRLCKKGDQGLFQQEQQAEQFIVGPMSVGTFSAADVVVTQGDFRHRNLLRAASIGIMTYFRTPTFCCAIFYRSVKSAVK